MKLTLKFILLISAVSLATLISLSLLVYFFTSATVSDTIAGGQLELAQQTVDKIDRLLEQKYSEIQIIASDQTVGAFLGGSSDLLPELVHRIDDLTLVSGPWNDLELYDTHSHIVFSLDPSHLIKDEQSPEEQSVYAPALQGGVAYSEMFQDSDSGKPSMLFAAPVRDETKAGSPIVGVVIGHLAWPVVTEVLASTQGELVDLYNSHGFEIANKEGNYGSLLKEDRSGEQIFQKALAGRDGSEVTLGIDRTYQSLTSYATEKGFAGFRGNEWVLIIETPTSVAFAPAVGSSIKISLALLPIILIGALLLLWFVVRFLKPINVLKEASTELAAGDLSKRVEVRSHDEIGQLGVSFNAMAGKLQESYRTLEGKVAERTAELGKKMDEVYKVNTLMVGRELKMIELKKKIADLEKDAGLPPAADAGNA